MLSHIWSYLDKQSCQTQMIIALLPRLPLFRSMLIAARFYYHFYHDHMNEWNGLTFIPPADYNWWRWERRQWLEIPANSTRKRRITENNCLHRGAPRFWQRDRRDNRGHTTQRIRCCCGCWLLQLVSFDVLIYRIRWIWYLKKNFTIRTIDCSGHASEHWIMPGRLRPDGRWKVS